MHYIAVQWVHDDADYPVFLYYELDEERYEHRKVEQYRDGTIHSAEKGRGQGDTFLAWEPHPTPEEIMQDPEFQLSFITAQDFERIWQQATQPELAAA